MKTIIAACFVAQTLLSVPAQADVDYRFDQVKRKVVLTTPKEELPVAAGHRAQAGDKVQTGWFSYALIASDHYRAKFEIFSSTNVQLAGGAPGVILSLERGRGCMRCSTRSPAASRGWCRLPARCWRCAEPSTTSMSTRTAAPT